MGAKHGFTLSRGIPVAANSYKLQPERGNYA